MVASIFGVDDVGVLRVPLEIATDEWAQRDDELAALALCLESATDEGRAESGALVTEIDLGVHEVRPPAPAHVADVTDEHPVEVHLVPVFLLVVAHLRGVVTDAVRLFKVCARQATSDLPAPRSARVNSPHSSVRRRVASEVGRALATITPSIMSPSTTGHGRPRTRTDTTGPPERRRSVRSTPTNRGGHRKPGVTRPRRRASRASTRAASAKRIVLDSMRTS